MEDLQGDRNQPVYLLDELVKQTPPGVYLKGFKQDGQKVSVGGYAHRRSGSPSCCATWPACRRGWSRPDLIEVKSTGLGQGKSAKKVVEFNLVVNIKRPRDKDQRPTAPKARREDGQPRRGRRLPPAKSQEH